MYSINAILVALFRPIPCGCPYFKRPRSRNKRNPSLDLPLFKRVELLNHLIQRERRDNRRQVSCRDHIEDLGELGTVTPGAREWLSAKVR